MRKTTLIISVLIGGIVAIVAALPLAWIGPHIVPPQMAQGAQYSGTIWRGQANLSFAKSRASVTFKTLPLKLFTGGGFLDFTVLNKSFNLRGVAGFNQAQDIQINADISQLPLRNPRIRGLHGQITSQIRSAEFGKQCKAISGQARTDFLQANEATWFWRGPELTGPIRCDDGNIVIEMAGQEDGQGFTVDLRFKADGLYTANIVVDSSDPRAAVVLSFYGFEARGARFELSETGRWY